MRQMWSWTGRRITCCATSDLIQPATQKGLSEYSSAGVQWRAERLAKCSPGRRSAFLRRCLLPLWSMSLAALIAVKSEAAPHPAWGSDARPIRRLLVSVWNPWDAGNCEQQQTNKRTFAFDV